jgi:hypothetical protein
VPSVVAASAGIHVHEVEVLVAHDFQDVRVAADKKARPQLPEFLPSAPVVVAGITADVRHVDGDAFAFPTQILREVGAEFCPVNVPINSPDRFEGSETIQYVRSSEISRVPHLVAFVEVTEDGVIQKTVCV